MRNILGLDRSKLNTDEHDLVSELTNNLSDHEWKGVIALYVHRGTAVLVTKTGLFNYVLDDTEGWAYVDVKDPRNPGADDFENAMLDARADLEQYRDFGGYRITRALISDVVDGLRRKPKGRMQELKKKLYRNFNG